MSKKHPVHKVSSEDHVSMGVRIGWGFGGIADNFIMNVLNVIFLLLYVQYFKMPPVLAGAALALPRFFDAITDPLIGNLSDNTRSRWGRRRPYMLVGAILSAVILPFFWLPPSGAENAIWYQNPAFIFASVLGCFYALTYTLFVVPYTALGYELTPDYDEKTRVLAWRMYLGLGAGMLVPWAYKFAQHDTFSNEAIGAVWTSVGFGIIIIITGLIPVFACPERKDIQGQETSPFFKAVWATVTNKPFMILQVAYIFIIVGLMSAGSLGGFLNNYYICGGNKDFGGLMIGLSGTIAALVSYFSMFLIKAVSTRTGKKPGMILGLCIALVGILGGWISMDPRWPMAQLLTMAIMCMGLQGCWLMVSSMVADVCDEDELKTGLRREGMFGAVNGFALKAALGLTGLIGGILLQFSGFDANALDAFEARTIEQVIEPSRAWTIDDEDFRAATTEFEKSCVRFVEISEDKSSIEGSKWTVIGRLFKGEKVYFRWYDFEEAALEYLDAVEIYASLIPEERDLKMMALLAAESVNLLDDLETEVGDAQETASFVSLATAADFEVNARKIQDELNVKYDEILADRIEALKVQTADWLVTRGELDAYTDGVRAGFLSEFEEQKKISLSLKVLIVGFQAIGILIALGIFAFYPITRKHAEETRRLLNERRASTEATK